MEGGEGHQRFIFQRGSIMAEKVILPDDLQDKIASFPEYSMGAHKICVVLKDGRRYEDVIVGGGEIVKVGGKSQIPFNTGDIMDIINRA
jgi:hypothetical protein